MLASSYFESVGRQVSGFVVDDGSHGVSVAGLAVLAWERFRVQQSQEKTELFVALSYQKLNKLREEKFCKVIDTGFPLTSFVHPSAALAEDVIIGQNCLILENCVIQPGARVADNVHIWSGSHVGHGAEVSAHVFLSSHVVLAGNSKIGERSFLGANCSIKESVSLGKEAIVGMGAEVTRSLGDGATIVQLGSVEMPKDDPRSRVVRQSLEGG